MEVSLEKLNLVFINIFIFYQSHSFHPVQFSLFPIVSFEQLHHSFCYGSAKHRHQHPANQLCESTIFISRSNFVIQFPRMPKLRVDKSFIAPSLSIRNTAEQWAVNNAEMTRSFILDRNLLCLYNVLFVRRPVRCLALCFLILLAHYARF